MAITRERDAALAKLRVLESKIQDTEIKRGETLDLLLGQYVFLDVDFLGCKLNLDVLFFGREKKIMPSHHLSPLFRCDYASL